MSANGRFKVLVIDDDPSIRMLVTNMLRSKGFDSAAASDGSQGIGAAKKENPDLILLDVNMPVMDGVTACKKLKEDPETSSIPIVFMTTMGGDSDRMRGFDAGGDDYVIKPVNYKELLARMKRYTDHHGGGDGVDLSPIRNKIKSCIEHASKLGGLTSLADVKSTSEKLLVDLQGVQEVLKD